MLKINIYFEPEEMGGHLFLRNWISFVWHFITNTHDDVNMYFKISSNINVIYILTYYLKETT